MTSCLRNTVHLVKYASLAWMCISLCVLLYLFVLKVDVGLDSDHCIFKLYEPIMLLTM